MRSSPVTAEQLLPVVAPASCVPARAPVRVLIVGGAGGAADGIDRLSRTWGCETRQTPSGRQALAPTPADVLVVGENGTGKELIANAIHVLGAGPGRPFMKVNCAAIPQALFEAELFGHQRGAVTGAIADRPGLFEAASGGTVLLDEIGELPLHLQVKLLRVLQDRHVAPIGSTRARRVDFRLSCATNSDVGSAARQPNTASEDRTRGLAGQVDA